MLIGYNISWYICKLWYVLDTWSAQNKKDKDVHIERWAVHIVHIVHMGRWSWRGCTHVKTKPTDRRPDVSFSMQTFKDERPLFSWPQILKLAFTWTEKVFQAQTLLKLTKAHLCRHLLKIFGKTTFSINAKCSLGKNLAQDKRKNLRLILVS